MSELPKYSGDRRSYYGIYGDDYRCYMLLAVAEPGSCQNLIRV